MAKENKNHGGRGLWTYILLVLFFFFLALFAYIFITWMRRADFDPDRVEAANASAGYEPATDFPVRFTANVLSSDDNVLDPGKLIGMTVGKAVQGLSLKTEENIDTEVPSGGVTNEFRFYSDKGEFYIKAINVYQSSVYLKDCTICSVRFTEDSGIYGLADEIRCGIENRDRVRNHYIERSLYLETDEVQIYKTNNEDIRFYEIKDSEGKSTYPMIARVNEVDGIFSYDEGKLGSYRLEAPELLYYDLLHNVDIYEQEQMSPEELAALRRQRDHYLEELKAAFDAAGVEVEIDDTDGTVAMKSDILFDFDSYVIKEGAKQYLNDFFDVYMSVLMRADISTSIASVRFEGHTDTSGSYAYNKTLSLKRAQSVLDYCENRSSLDANEKAELARLAEAVGYSYDYPVYDSNGAVNMAASRRVEINFVIGTKYRLSCEQEMALNGERIQTVSASEVYIGNSYIPAQWTVAKLTDEYSLNPDLNLYEQLFTDTMVLFTGDKTKIGAVGNPEIERFDLSDKNVGRIETTTSGIYSEEDKEIYFFEALEPGTCRIDAYSSGAGYKGADLNCHVTIHVLEEKDGLPLKLTPDKTSYKKGDNVKFLLKGDYDGDVWAFVYFNGVRRGDMSSKAEWLDSSTLSVDITEASGLTIILTPAGNPDILLGFYRQ